MAKRKKASKVRKKKGATARPKARKVTKAAKATQRAAKPKPAPMKKAARKDQGMTAPAAPAAETVSVEALVDTSEIREESEPKPPSLI